MSTQAKPVNSNQQAIHDRLEATVRKHLQHPFLKPYAAHNVAAFEQAADWLEGRGSPLILDSFCGLGESTARLAQQFPGHAVIGIDKSAQRLARHIAPDKQSSDNYLLVRADTDDFWRLALAAGWRLDYHFLLYPNPWPKSAHLQRRCHGSPLFPSLLALGGQLELRSNWPLYISEFHQALTIAGQQARCEHFHPTEPMTAFERKYLAAGQRLWRCRCKLSSVPQESL